MLAIKKRVERVDSAVFLAAGRGEVVWNEIKDIKKEPTTNTVAVALQP